MNLGLRDKVAVVSGGSKGIGRAIAEEMASEGARVVLAARGEAALQETVTAIRAAGGNAIGVQADMTIKEDVVKVVKAAKEAFGPPDIAISSVYPPFKLRFEGTEDEDFRIVNDALVMSVVYLTRALVDDMKTKRWGRFVNIGSYCMKEPQRERPLILSNVGRAAVVGLNKTLATELAPYNITVNNIGTGSISSKLAVDFDDQFGDEFKAGQDPALLNPIPIGRQGRPDEMAALALFLCSERASYITGQTINCDGGLGRTLF